MALTIKNLAALTLPTTTGQLYQVPPGKAAIVKNIRCVNRDTVPRTINLFYRTSGGTNYQISPKNLTVPAGGLVVEENEVTLGAQDYIYGDASAVSIVDCTI